MELADFFSLEGLTLGGIIGSLIAALIFLGATYLAGLLIGKVIQWLNLLQFQSKLKRAALSPIVRYGILIGLSVAFALLVWPYVSAVSAVGERGGFVVMFTLLSLLVYAIARDVSFSRIGLVKAERSVASGTDYRDTLIRCKRSISFLGTGGYKLTENSEFEAAVERCAGSGGFVRILISRPDVTPLKQAEKMANVDPGDYSVKVRSTLKKLRRLKQDRAFPIEVRFHNRDNATRMQEFRMMFVDEEHLFLSYNLYGQGDGSTIPQVIMKKEATSNPLQSFYHPFSESFERVWKASAKWDFDEYLKD